MADERKLPTRAEILAMSPEQYEQARRAFVRRGYEDHAEAVERRASAAIAKRHGRAIERTSR